MKSPKMTLRPLSNLRAIEQIDRRLADELIDEIMKQTPSFFEKLVVSLLVRMGYGGSYQDAAEVLGKIGEGIGGVIREDKLGFDMIYVQAKRRNPSQTIGRPEIQAFVGALAGQGANKGLFVTTAKFSKEAKSYVNKQHSTKVVLLDGEKLCRLMIGYNLGVAVENIYQVKDIDSDYFETEFI